MGRWLVARRSARQQAIEWRRRLLVATVCCVLVYGVVGLVPWSSLAAPGGLTIPRGGRHLMDSKYPPDAFSFDQLKHGAIVLHCIGLLYIFMAIAIVADEFFVPLLEHIVEMYNISDDVAGATLMAAGGSAPELFAAVNGVFFAQSDIGFGTIVGSATFNVLFVVGMCAFFSRQVLDLDWWPLCRDCTWYAFDLVMVYIFFQDHVITWWEAGLLLLFYFSYVTFMSFNPIFENYVKTRVIGANWRELAELKTMRAIEDAAYGAGGAPAAKSTDTDSVHAVNSIPATDSVPAKDAAAAGPPSPARLSATVAPLPAAPEPPGLESVAPESGIPESGIPAPGIPESRIPAPGIPEPGIPESGIPASHPLGQGPRNLVVRGSFRTSVALTDMRARLGTAKGANAVALNALLLMLSKPASRSSARSMAVHPAPTEGDAEAGTAWAMAEGEAVAGGGMMRGTQVNAIKNRRFRGVAALLITAHKELEISADPGSPAHGRLSPSSPGGNQRSPDRPHARPSSKAVAAAAAAAAEAALPKTEPSPAVDGGGKGAVTLGEALPAASDSANEGPAAGAEGGDSGRARHASLQSLESMGSLASGRGGEEDDEGGDGVDFTWPATARARFFFLLTLPVMFVFAYTIPNVQQPFWARLKLFGIVLSFGANILWLGILSYFAVWWAIELGAVASIPDVVMGYTILALGTSIPDLAASIIVARQGLGDMAVACTVGSNIFDITLGLPLPWFFWTVGYQKPFKVGAGSIGFSLILIIVILGLLLSSVAALKWRMPKSLGVVLLCIYAVFLALVIPVELGVWSPGI